MWKGRGGVESSRQQPLDRGGNLYRLKLNALGSEMDIVAVIFGMTAHRQVKIVGGDVQRRHYCRRDGVSSVDALVCAFQLCVSGDAFAVADWGRSCPNESGFRCVSLDCFEKCREGLLV